MKVEFNKHGVCMCETCLFWQTCAQNITAGEYREESGFTPKVLFSANECLTADTPPVFQDGKMVPENIDHLDCGMVSINDNPSDSLQEKYNELKSVANSAYNILVEALGDCCDPEVDKVIRQLKKVIEEKS